MIWGTAKSGFARAPRLKGMLGRPLSGQIPRSACGAPLGRHAVGPGRPQGFMARTARVAPEKVDPSIASDDLAALAAVPETSLWPAGLGDEGEVHVQRHAAGVAFGDHAPARGLHLGDRLGVAPETLEGKPVKVLRAHKSPMFGGHKSRTFSPPPVTGGGAPSPLTARWRAGDRAPPGSAVHAGRYPGGSGCRPTR